LTGDTPGPVAAAPDGEVATCGASTIPSKSDSTVIAVAGGKAAAGTAPAIIEVGGFFGGTWPTAETGGATVNPGVSAGAISWCCCAAAAAAAAAAASAPAAAVGTAAGLAAAGVQTCDATPAGPPGTRLLEHDT